MGKAAQNKTAIVQCVVSKGGQRKGREGHQPLAESGRNSGGRDAILNSKGDQILPEKSVGTKRLHFCVRKRLGRTAIIPERLIYPRK